jgi:uncharacterized Zn finger protein
VNRKKVFLELLASLKSVTREEAAKGQLETAIWLWFHQDDERTVSDPVSIHTLAVAAQGVLTSIARDKKVEPPQLVKWMKERFKKGQTQLQTRRISLSMAITRGE